MALLMTYLLLEYLRVFATCLGGLAVVYLVVDFVEKIRKFVGYQAELRHILWYFVLKCPGILFQITPLAVLMSTLLTASILSRNNEITAMRSSGISLYWVSVPFLIIAQALSLLMLWASDAVIPGANQQAEALREIKIEKRNPRAVFQGNEIWVRLGDQTLMRGDLPDDNAPRIYGVSLYHLERTSRSGSSSSRGNCCTNTTAGSWSPASAGRSRATRPSGLSPSTVSPFS